jgi:hypothetical protein
MKVTRNLLMSLAASLALAIVAPVLAQEATSPDADAASPTATGQPPAATRRP